MKRRPVKSSLAPILLAAAAALSSCALPMAHSQSLRASFSPTTADAENGFDGVDSSSSSSSSSSTSSSSLSMESGPQHIRSQGSSLPKNDEKSSPDDGSNKKEEPTLSKPKHFPLTAKLSTSTHHRAINSNNNVVNYKKGGRINKMNNELFNSPEIPLVGIGVGNLPHNKIPYILANALAGAQYQNSRGNGSNSGSNKLTGGEKDDYTNYRLIDTSHSSALEVLVGRSLGRLFGTSGTSVGNSNNLVNNSRNTNNFENDNTSYHVMIKIWHTHLGYERTMLSIQDTLSDILPGTTNGATGATNNNGISNNKPHLNNKGIGTLSTASDNSFPKKQTPSSSYPSPNNRIGNTSILVHAILQYPRCYDTLFQSQTYLTSQSYSSSSSSTTNPRHTSCLEEEESLDSNIHATGPSPLLDKDNAWKRSYRALEELYHHGTLESIGVANFETKDMEELYDLATVGPHIYQGSLRTLMTEGELVEGLVKHGVHFQCFDVVSVILGGREAVPRAYRRLERMGARFGGMMTTTRRDEGDGGDGRDGRPTSGVDDDYGIDGNKSSYGYSAIQMVLGWLVQRGVGVIPGTKNLTHLIENGPMSLATMPEFNARESLDIENAIMSFVTGVDLDEESTVINNNIGDNSKKGGHRFGRGEFGSEEIFYDETITEYHTRGKEIPADEGVVATFFNALRRNVRIFHVHPTTGQQIQVSGSIPPGRSGRLIVNPRDVLIAYDGYGVAVKKFLVNADHGGRMDFSVES